MKTTLRSILIAALALITVFGSIPAFAAETGGTVMWVDFFEEESYYYEHLYGGKITEGINELENCTEDGDYYFEFDAPETGYYFVSSEVYFGEFGEDGNIYDAAYPHEWIETEEECVGIAYLEKGTVVLGAYIWKDEFDSIEIEYIDSEIVDVEYDESLTENLIIGSDIYINENRFWYFADEYAVEFSNGRTVSTVDSCLDFELTCDPVNGENTVCMTFGNYKEEKKMNLYYIDSLVESVELSNTEYHINAYEYYDGSHRFFEYCAEEITVSYTDGTSETFVYGWNEEAGQRDYINIFGNKHYVTVCHEEENFDLNVYIADHLFNSYDCKAVDADAQGNRDRLREKVELSLEYFIDDAGYYWVKMWNPDYAEYFFVNAKHFMESFAYLSDICSEIEMYMEYIF